MRARTYPERPESSIPFSIAPAPPLRQKKDFISAIIDRNGEGFHTRPGPLNSSLYSL
jgi:hypothetical protein